MLDSLAVGGALCGLLTSRVPAVHRILVEPCLGEVMREHLGLRDGNLSEFFLECLPNASVQMLALRLEERLVCRVLDQGVLEGVGRIGRCAAAED